MKHACVGLGLLILSSSLLLALPPPAASQSTKNQPATKTGKKTKKKPKKVTRLGQITVIAKAVTARAPSAQPLSAIQPTSVMGIRLIRDSLRRGANYTNIIRFAPSVSVDYPEGPGLGKMEETSIRGLQDRQFNVTFGGIPFGNQSDLRHSTSIYFTSHVVG